MVALVLASLGLCVPARAGPALNDHRRPTITYAISGIRGTNGWYRGSKGGNFVVLRWTVRDDGAVVVTFGCGKQVIKGPTAGTTRTCTAWSDNGIASRTTEVIKIDAEPPRLVAVVVSVLPGTVRLRWKASRDADFLLSRSPGRGGGRRSSVVFQGTERHFVDRTVKGGVKYHYKLRAIDPAGNSVAKTVSATPPSLLFAPAAGARLSSPQSISFAWKAMPSASYYNLQLWFEGERVFSAWPSRPRFRLLVPWEYGGARRYLPAGRYTWYVWPGRGSRGLGAYGPPLGSSTFFVVR